MRTTKLTLAACVAGLALSAACGSTVQQRGTITSGAEGLGQAGPQDGLPTTSSEVLAPGTQGNGVTGQPGGGGSATTSGGSLSTTGGNPVQSGAPAPGNGRSGANRPTAGSASAGHGYDAKHIYLGFNTINNIHTFAEASGQHGLDFGDMKADAEAAIGAINAHGGVLGRKLVGVYHDEDVTQATANPAQNSQTTCAALTQDTKVFAAVINDTAGDDNDNFYSCMTKAGTPFFTSADYVLDRGLFKRYAGYLYSTQSPTWEAFAPVFVNRLAALNYFHPWNTTTGKPGTASVKLGMLFPDTVVGHRVAATTERLAHARGVATYPYFYADGTTQGVALYESSIQRAVLPFQSNNVTHVLADASSVIVFTVAAEQQRYRPRYAVESLNELYSANGNVPAGQFNGALGVGWSPVGDTNHVEGAAAEACLHEVQTREGKNYAGQGTPTYVALIICDAVRLIAGALNASGDISVSGLASGLGQIGPQFQPASTFRSAFSSTRADIVGAVRDLGYDAKCSCFGYLSSTLWPV